ncbi:hypothetical protein DFJ73DRAFT_805890 [Zopfochytrium polystomum]|nr:hypothetical protein DFJ73DRAFT_805890 [Zopfochytrium polystomum]
MGGGSGCIVEGAVGLVVLVGLGQAAAASAIWGRSPGANSYNLDGLHNESQASTFASVRQKAKCVVRSHSCSTAMEWCKRMKKGHSQPGNQAPKKKVEKVKTKRTSTQR